LAPALTEDLDLAGSCVEQPFEDFDRGGFACPVGAEQAEAFPPLDLQIEAVDRLDGRRLGGVAFAQISAEDSGGHRRSRPCFRLMAN